MLLQVDLDWSETMLSAIYQKPIIDPSQKLKTATRPSKGEVTAIRPIVTYDLQADYPLLKNSHFNFG